MGRQLDSVRLGPQDREAVRRIVDLAAPIARAANAPHSPATPAAQEALTEQVASATGAPADVNGDQAMALATKSTGNFVSELLRRGYALAKKIVSGEINFAQKEIRAGVYRTAGASIALYAGAEAYAGWSALSKFIADNAEALKDFVMAQFHNPKLVEMIDWIVGLMG